MSRLAVFVALLLGCQSKEPSKEPSKDTPAQRKPEAEKPASGATDMSASVGNATPTQLWRVAIGDLDGNGTSEIVVIDATQIRVLDGKGAPIAALPITDGIQTVIVHDGAIYAGWGITREHRDTKVSFTRHRLEGKTLTRELVLAPASERQDTAAIVPLGDGLLLAYFDAKYTVASVIAVPMKDGWQVTPIASLRMATSYGSGDLDGDGQAELVVGRQYGDDKGSDGDAFVLRADGTRTPIPTTRGLRSLLVADVDADGRAEVVMGDGWHQNYGTEARGLVTLARSKDGSIRSEPIEQVDGQYGTDKILLASVGGRLPVIVTLGNKGVRVLRHDGTAWTGSTVSGPARDIAVGDLDGEPGDELLILGEPSQILRLR